MVKKIFIGIASVLGLLFLGVLIVLHSSEGGQVIDMMRKLHGK